MPHPDPDWDDRPELGYDASADRSYPRRRAPRHVRHSAQEPALAAADLWPDVDTTPGHAAGHAYPDDDWVHSSSWDMPTGRGAADQQDVLDEWGPAIPAERDAPDEWGSTPLVDDEPSLADESGDDGFRALPEAANLPALSYNSGQANLPALPEPPDQQSARSRRGRRRRSAGSSGGRAGRNLPAAIGVGVVLGGAVLASLLLWRPAFVLIAGLASAVGTWEMVRAVRSSGAKPPMVPLVLGGTMMIGIAWTGGPDVLPLGLIAVVIAVLVWRLGDGVAEYQRDVTTAVLIATYVPFLASFAVLLARPGDGHLRVLAALVGVVLSDTAGYGSGVLLGRHPMAPSISPKKSWEGFVGSLVCTAAGEALLLHLLLGAAWWQGVVFGLAVSAASVLGDLAESLIKRDLKVKDMSSLLPGHGGLMDRLDSILFAAPVAYALLTLFVHVTL